MLVLRCGICGLTPHTGNSIVNQSMPPKQKTRNIFIFVLFLSIGGVLFFAPVLTHAEEQSQWIPGEIVVELEPGSLPIFSRLAAQILALEHGATIQQEIPQIHTFVLKTSEFRREALARLLSGHPLVKRATKNFLYEPATTIPNDPLYSTDQWHHEHIGNPKAWDITTGDASQIIAVLDSGIDSDHEDLASRLLSGWDFYYNDANYEDICGHGTETAGVVGAVTNNGIGVAAVTWQPKVLPLKIANDSASCLGSYSAISNALVYAADQGARVANISYAIYNAPELQSSLSYFQSKGGLVFGAGGNGGAFKDLPDNPYLVSVAPTDKQDGILSSADSGPYIDLSAPGYFIRSTYPGNLYGSHGGSSAAAPIAAGVAALVMAADPTLLPGEVEAFLEGTAVDLGNSGYDPVYGWGRVDSWAAVSSAGGLPPPPPPPPAPPLFFDDFEVSEWNGLWKEDSQNNWSRSNKKAFQGKYSASAKGTANNATLTSVPIDLQGNTNATITFSWFIVPKVDKTHYIAFDASSDGGKTWAQYSILRGDVSPEGVWVEETVTLGNLNILQLRFRANLKDKKQLGYVDVVKVTGQ